MTNDSNPSRRPGEAGTAASAASKRGQSTSERKNQDRAQAKGVESKDTEGQDTEGHDTEGHDTEGRHVESKAAEGKTRSQGNNRSKSAQGNNQSRGIQGKGSQGKSQSRGNGQRSGQGAAGAPDTLSGGNGGSSAAAKTSQATRASNGDVQSVDASTGANGAAAQSARDGRSADARPEVEAVEGGAVRGAEQPLDSSAEPSVNADGSAEPSVNAPAGDRPTGLQLLLHLGRPRATRAQLVVALLCGLLGFALVTQVHSQANTGLSSARQADLVDVLDNLSAKSEQLQSRIADEQRTLAKLTGGTGQTEAALEEAQQRATTLRILAGTIGATGPGIDLRISDAGHNVTADVLLDTLEELRDAGAEAVEIRGSGTPAPAVRLVASSYFVDSQDGQGVIADGTPLSPPYDILAIGDPPTLAAAMGIPGGVLDTLKSKGARGVVSQSDTIRITALHALTPPQYAHPAASPSAGS